MCLTRPIFLKIVALKTEPLLWNARDAACILHAMLPPAVKKISCQTMCDWDLKNYLSKDVWHPNLDARLLHLNFNKHIQKVKELMQYIAKKINRLFLKALCTGIPNFNLYEFHATASLYLRLLFRKFVLYLGTIKL